ncbi:pteridine reductase [Moraxella oculi]|uniref:Pteridine reductase n=1 Tax=Moraxella oculi TaxID=2940516 RepID=A0ABW8U6X3_9GAMM
MRDQKVALITGGSRRIGAQICRTLHALGHQIIIHYAKSQAAAQALAKELNALRAGSAKTICLDFADIDDLVKLNRFQSQTLALFGRLDVLIHNASSFYPTDLTCDTTTISSHYHELFLTNSKAPLILSHLFLKELTANAGQIISLLDIHADNKPFVNYPIYTMAKSSHRAMVQALALELAPVVRVNGVSPGVNVLPDDFSDAMCNTLRQSVPLKKIGTPTDISQAVAFLLDASYVTGQIIAVDGGRSLTLCGGQHS